MNRINLILATLTVSLLAISCNQVTEKPKEEQKGLTQTNEKVQKTIDDLGLVYVEEGAQEIITYDEVNAAQQAWCDALVKIGKLKEEDGNYKAFAEQVLSKRQRFCDGTLGKSKIRQRR